MNEKYYLNDIPEKKKHMNQSPKTKTQNKLQPILLLLINIKLKIIHRNNIVLLSN